jgi:hypothetical protein
VFKNRVLRRIFGHERDEETGGWRRLNNLKTYMRFGVFTAVRWLFVGPGFGSM